MGKGFKGIALGTAIAGIAGYVAGVLTAPKSGRETREQIRTAANASISETEKQLKRLHTELNVLLAEAQQKLQDVKGQSEDGFQQTVASAEGAKNKVREILSAVHEGETDDKDLQKAVKDAEKAIDHIKKYLQK